MAEQIAVEVALRARTREYVRGMEAAEKATRDFQKQLQTSNVAKFNAGLERLTSTALKVAAAATVVGLLVKEIIEAGVEFERLNKTLIAATGSAEAAAREYRFLSDTFNDLGLSIRETGEEYAKFLISAQGTVFQGRLAREIFVNLSTALSGVGSSAANSSAIFDQLTQILAKPTTQLEDLLVIAERLPGTFDALADAMERPKAEIFELVSAGELLAEDWLIPFSEIMRDRIPESTDTAEQSFIRLQNAIFELEAAIAGAGILDAASTLSEQLAQAARNVQFLVEQFDAIGISASEGLKDAANIITRVFLPGLGNLLGTYDALTLQQQDFAEAQRAAAEEQSALDKVLTESLDERNRLEIELAKNISERTQLQKAAEEAALEASRAATQEALSARISASKEALAQLKKDLAEGERLEKKYADEVKNLQEELTDFRKGAEDDERAARLAGLSDRRRQAAILDEIRRKEIEYGALLLQGENERSAAVAAETRELAAQVTNARERERIQREAAQAFEYTKELQIQAAEEQRQAQEKQNQETQQSIDDQIDKIGELQAVMKELTADTQVVEIDADTTAINQKIDDLEQRLKQLNATIAAGGRAGGGAIGFASGGAPRRLRPGMIRGPGTSTSDSILARVSAGEHAFITKASRARKLWPLLNTLNFGSDSMVRQVLDNLPAGLGSASRPAPVLGAFARGGSVNGEMQPVNIILPGSSRPAAKLFGERDEVTAFEDALARWSRGYTS